MKFRIELKRYIPQFSSLNDLQPLTRGLDDLVSNIAQKSLKLVQFSLKTLLLVVIVGNAMSLGLGNAAINWVDEEQRLETIKCIALSVIGLQITPLAFKVPLLTYVPIIRIAHLVEEMQIDQFPLNLVTSFAIILSVIPQVVLADSTITASIVATIGAVFGKMYAYTPPSSEHTDRIIAAANILPMLGIFLISYLGKKLLSRISYLFSSLPLNPVVFKLIAASSLIMLPKDRTELMDTIIAVAFPFFLFSLPSHIQNKITSKITAPTNPELISNRQVCLLGAMAGATACFFSSSPLEQTAFTGLARIAEGLIGGGLIGAIGGKAKNALMRRLQS